MKNPKKRWRFQSGLPAVIALLVLLLRHEILNALLVGKRRKRLTPELTHAFLDDLSRLPVDVDELATPAAVFDATQSLCRKHGLTAYDAAYLELAERGSPCCWPQSIRS